MGRQRQFDEAEVLEKAMLTFWEFGYEKTTVRTLEKSMGINQFSIYATFESKEFLYERVLQIYHQKLNDEFLLHLQKPTCKLRDIEHFLNTFALQIRKKKIPNGCLMVQSTAHLDHFDERMRKIVVSFFESIRKLFHRAIQNSVNLGELPESTDVWQSSEYLLGLAQSISVYGKIKSQKAVKSYIAFALERLK